MGDRSFVVEVPEKIGPGTIRRGLGRFVEQHHAGGDKDPQARHHGPEGLPRRGADHEEAAPCQIDSVVRRLHHGRADLHNHRTHEERQFTGILTRYARYGLAPPLAFLFCPN